MKKQIMSLVLAVVMVIGMAIPAMAAEPVKTVEQRIEAIKDTYGIEVIYDKAVVKHVPAQLTQLEAAFGKTGSVFTKKVKSDWEDRITDKYPTLGYPTTFKIFIQKGVAETADAICSMPRGGIFLYVLDTGKVVSSISIVHEFGHAIGYSGKSSEKFSQLSNELSAAERTSLFNSGKLIPDYCISSWAATSSGEDYAECFAYAVINGGDKPLSVGKDTLTYRKMKAMYEDVKSAYGTGSRATQRIAAYLGIELPTEKK